MHSEWKVTAFVGSVADIPVSEGDTVSSGETLLSFNDTDDTGAYEIFLEQRAKLESQMDSLFRVYTDGYLYAPCDGVISGLDTSTATEKSTSTERSTSTESSTATENSMTVGAVDFTIENVTYAAEAPAAVSHLVTEGSTAYSATNSGSAIYLSAEVSSGETVQLSTLDDLASAVSEAESLRKSLDDLLTDLQKLADADPSNQELSQAVKDLETSVSSSTSLESDLKGLDFSDNTLLENIDDLNKELSESNSQLDSISNIVGAGAGDDLVDKVQKLADELSVLEEGSSGDTAALEEEIAQLREELQVANDMLDQASGSGGFGGLEGEAGSYEEGYAAGMEAALGGLGDIDLGGLGDMDLSDYGDLSDFDLSEYGDLSDFDLSGYDLSEYGDLADIYGDITDLGDLSDLYGDIDMSELEGLEEAGLMNEAFEEDVAETYGIEDRVLLSLIPQDTMTITITVDEMDILKLEIGQTARVTLDAFPGQSFEGTVTGIHRSGTNSGGNTKYTADIEIEREDGMLAGMNASAQVILDTVEDVLCIPEAALEEENGITYVYTTYNAGTDELGGKVEVTTGISDGTTVQILSGLEEGDEYFYKYLDVVNYESASSASEGGFF